MMYKYLVILALLLLSSCASILNKGEKKVIVHTKEPSIIVYGNDTIRTESHKGLNSVGLLVQRNKAPLRFEISSDSTKKQVSIKSRLSGSYYYNISTTLGLGLLIDYISDKRFTYPTPLVFDHDLNITSKIPFKVLSSTSNPKVYRVNNYEKDYKEEKERTKITKKKGVYLNLTFPYVNYFSLSPDNESRKNSFGFLGVGTGLDYYYKDHRFFNFTIAGAMDFFIPFPASVNYQKGEYENAWSIYGLLTHNHAINKFSFGYGFSLSRNGWRYKFLGEENDINYGRYNTSLGLAFDARYYFSDSFNVGLCYRPTFARLKSKADKNFGYEHLISLDFAFKFRLHKGK